MVTRGPNNGSNSSPNTRASAGPHTGSHSGRRPGAANPKSFVGLVLVLILAGAGGLAYLASRHHAGPAATVVDPNLPPAVAKGHSMGRPDAPVQILEFADFECPACGNYSVVTEPDVRKRVIEPGLARVTYYDFPLPQHKNTMTASESAACADDQGKFWEMHDRLFQGQTDWNTEATSDPVSVMQGYAKAIGLDVDKWRACVDARTHQRDIDANKAEGERRQVNQTPTFVIGSRMVAGSLTDDQIKAYVDSARASAGAAGSGAAH
jgi:protein-disulfide isomerase